MIPVDNKSQQLRVDMSTARDVKCTQCNHVYFTAARRLKFISRLVSPNGQDLLVPVEVLLCNKCGKELEPDKAVANVIPPEPAEALVNPSEPVEADAGSIIEML